MCFALTIKEQLLHDKLHNRKIAVDIAIAACSSTQTFAELMSCFLSNEYRLAQRAAWSVSHAVSINPKFIFPYIKNLIEQLLRKDVHDAVIRNSTRILQRINVPEEYHGEMMNACFLLAEKADTPIAIKAFALSVLYKLYLIYPDIKMELKTIAEANPDIESAAVKNVSRKIIKALDKGKAPGVNN